MSNLVTWRTPEFATLPVGGKARALGLASGHGFLVPDWAVVLPSACLDAAGEMLLADSTREEVETWLRATPGALFAVRSSALDEDGAQYSFAGQLDSYLNVAAADVPEKIIAVWRSGFSERIYLYRRQAGLGLPPPVPAVILQVMVAPDSAGVAFSSDPVSGQRGIAVVAAVRGLGEQLVSGEREGDSFSVDIEERIVARKTEINGNAVLNDKQVWEIARLARRVAAKFGRPQDIEWALHGNQLFLLQARPITSLAVLADPDGVFQLWDNSNIAESYSGKTTPLTFSFARHVYEEVYRQFVGILRVPKRRIHAHREVFARMLGLVEGRVYYNLLSWYRTLALLPGFAINRKFMEQMMGVKEGVPEDVLASILPTQKAGLRDYLEVLGTLGGLWWSHVTLAMKVRAFYVRLNEALRAPNHALEEMRPDQLAASYRSLEEQLLTRWDAPLINDFFAMIYYGLLRKLVTIWGGDAAGTLQNDLVSGQGGIISAEPAERMQETAALVRETPGLAAGMRELLEPDIAAFLSAHPALKSAVESYLEKFGDRCLEELKLESETLHENPLMLLHAVGQLASSPVLERQAGPRVNCMQRAEEIMQEKLRGHPLRRALFSFVLKRARGRVSDRENLRFERTRVFGRVRRIFLELGRRFYGLDRLDAPRDVFLLTIEEVLAFVEGTAVTTDLRGLVAVRQAEFARYEAATPADRFSTRGVVYSGNDFRPPTAAQSAPEGDALQGIGCCPGIVRGRVRVILNPRAAELVAGEILVAPRTDPGWIMLFPAAAGLLVEHGSLLSHSAIVAREMGIPAVVSLAGITTWLQTGDEVELNGATGTVTRLRGKDLDDGK